LRPILSDGWFRYFGFRTPPDAIYCEGCLGEGGRILDADCPIRPCAMEKEIPTRADCAQYGCAKLKQRLVRREDVEQKIGAPIPADDYPMFIRPYENFPRLEELRKRSGLSA
jgi:hypothetical protein